MESTSASTSYHRVTVDGVGVFYRQAGPKNAPTIVLLHGFPSSSREFDSLIPLFATRYHVVAPDFPGFGQSDAPPPSSYAYTFDHLAETTNSFLEQLKIEKCIFFLHDYGGPVGFRVMLAHPERVKALILQNANVYQEGLGAKWAGIARYWSDPKGHPEVFDTFVSFAATQQRHTLGALHPERYNPDTWTDEYVHLSKPGQREIQAALLYDYRTNVASYAAWQAWLREHEPPTLVVWGRNDPSFIAPGAEAFRRDLPQAEIHLLDAGHFALDEKNDEVAGLVLAFLAKHPSATAPSIGENDLKGTTMSEANKANAVAFHKKAVFEGDVENAFRLYAAGSYRQHNPLIGDGMEGLRKFVASMLANHPGAHGEIKRVFADGDYVILHSHWRGLSDSPRGEAVVDIYRAEDGKVVEHWDVIQPIPEAAANNNTMF